MIYIIKIFIMHPHRIIDNNMGKREVDFIRKIAKGLGYVVNDKIKSGGPDCIGISIEQLLEMFPDDRTARMWFENVMWPDGPVCPRCHSGDNVALSTHKSMPYRCTGCKRHFSVKVGTILENSKIGYRKWIIAIYAMMTNAKGISSMKIHRDLDITQPTAWFLMQRIREAMTSLARQDEMNGPVEIDEAYIGGLEKNKHADKKCKTGKVAVVGIRDRHTGQVTASPVPETTAARLCNFVERHVHPDAVKYADENKAYNNLDNHDKCRRVCSR